MCGCGYEGRCECDGVSVGMYEAGIKGIGSVYKRHPVTKFEHGSHGVSKRNFNHMTVY